MFSIIVIILISPIRVETECTPRMSERRKNLTIGGFILAECDISTCDSVARIVYKKTNIVSPSGWTSVYEGVNSSNHHALNSKYNLTGRVDYFTLKASKKHLFEVSDLSLQDQGSWKCVVFDFNKWSKESNPLQVNLDESRCSVAIQISNKTPDVGNALIIDCIVSSCQPISTIEFEKTNTLQYTQWTPVYWFINESTHSVCDSGTNYTLNNRTDVTKKLSRYSLTIKQVVLGDQGNWRCVLYDSANAKHNSEAKRIFTLVTPKIGPTIQPPCPKIVTNQTYKFTCEVDGIHPEPTVTWVVNDVDHGCGTSQNIRHTGGLWSVHNTFEFTFTDVRMYAVECIFGAGDTDEWIRTNKNAFKVKEAAKVIYPKHEKKQEISINSNFSLMCIGSGYGHQISWLKEGKPVTDTDKYSFQACGPKEEECTSKLQSRHIDDQSQLNQYAGVYTCVIQLEVPYNSSDTSPEITVSISSVGREPNVASSNVTSNSTLNLMVKFRGGLSQWSMVYILIGVTVFFIILNIVICCCCKACKRSNRVDKGDAYQYYNTKDYILYDETIIQMNRTDGVRATQPARQSRTSYNTNEDVIYDVIDD